MIEYKIIIISSPGCKYNQSYFRDILKSKEFDFVKISKIENLATLDTTQLLKEFYNGFDAIFVIIKGEVIKDNFISEFNSFNEPIRETKRILKRRGLGDQRIKLFKFNGTNERKLNESFSNFVRILVQSELNPINLGIRKIDIKYYNTYNFESIPIKELLYASYKASYNFHYRSLFKAKETILKSGKYNKDELIYLLDSIFDAETARIYMFEELKKYKSLTIEEIIDLFDFSEKNIIRDIFYLKERGYIEEIPDNKLNHTKSIQLGKSSTKYKIKEIQENFKPNYFKSVSCVHDNNVCSHCGLCTSICPTGGIELEKDILVCDESKCISCGLCYSVCPRSFSIDNINKLIKKYDTSLKYSENLGYYKNVFSARTLKYAIRKVGQDGGVVTSLLYYLLDKKLVDAVITIKHSETYWKPTICIIDKLNDLDKTAGSTYVHAQILSVLDQTKNYDRVAIVALPCKINALSKGELFPVKNPLLNNIKYKLGLFCKKSFPYESLIKLFNDKFSASIDEIVKMDVNQGKFVLTIESGEIFSIPLEECNLFCSDFCMYCNDFTAESADISIGSVGSELGWSSIITRTMRGELLFNGALKHGLIEVKDISDTKPFQLKIKKQAEIKRSSSRPIEFNIVY